MTDDELLILLVDDEPDITTNLSAFLKRTGFRTNTADNGETALAIISDEKPDLVVMDVMMPRLDGYQTCALIKNNSEFKATPVVMLSSKDGLFDKAKGRIVGSDQYITKPFSRDELLGTIRTLVH